MDPKPTQAPKSELTLEKPAEAPKPKEDKKAKEREELNKKIAEKLKEYGGVESNIPLSDEYWGQLNQLRGLK